MNVKELKTLLFEFADEAEVRTEGCDCYGDIHGARDHGSYILLIRSDGDTRYQEENNIEMEEQ